MNISVTILTKNSSKYLAQVLEALESFDEVLIFDNGSTDHTLTIAKAYANVCLHQGNFEGFGATHNKASSLAKHDWILSIDSDEILSEPMRKELQALKKDPYTVYSFERHNYFNGRLIKGCGWYPDRQLRLYHRKFTQFDHAQVHESIMTNGLQTMALKGPLIHYSYEKVADFLAKMQSYSTLFAAQYQGKRKSSPTKAVAHGVFAFFKSYFLKRGFLYGYEGLLISTYNAHTAFYKYYKLYEANQKLKQSTT